MISRQVIRPSVVLALVWFTFLSLLGETQAKEEEIFLPPDCDAFTINGDNFKIKFEGINRDWAKVAKESAEVEVPRRGSKSGVSPEDGRNGAHADADEKPAANDGRNDGRNGDAHAENKNCYLPDDLFEWISERAGQLVSQLERYGKEAKAVQGPQRIVIDVLLLNTLADLDKLNKENIERFAWVPRKLEALFTEFIHRDEIAAEVSGYVRNLISANIEIERKVRGSNDPGKVWVANTQALIRILHEQRYSRELDQIIVTYLASPFNMMKRSVVYEQNRHAQAFNDGLYYKFATGKVPKSFPFAAQDAISHGVH